MKGKMNGKMKGVLLIAVFILSTIAMTIPITMAIDDPLVLTNKNLDGNGDDNVGDTVLVAGTGATPGLPVEIYWDAVTPENLLNTTTALGSGAFDSEVTIPVDIVGEHWIIAFDVTATTSQGLAFVIVPKIVLTPTSGLPTDSVTVEGTGFAATSDIILLFYETALPGKTITDEPVGTATADADEVFYVSYPPVDADSQTISVDATPWNEVETFTAAGTEYLFDDETGKITFGTGTDDPGVGLAITATYDSNGINDVSSESVGTGDGTTKVFPLEYSPVVDESELIKVGGETQTLDTDYSINYLTGTITFEVGHEPAASYGTVTDPDSDNTGNGVLAVSAVSDELTTTETWTIVAKADPTAWTVTGSIQGSKGDAATGVLYVIDEFSFTITEGAPAFITGDDFAFDTYSAEITADYDYYMTVTPTEGIETDALGSFTDSFIVPRQVYTDYLVTVLDEDGNMPTAAADYTIGACITLEPDEGPTGSVVTISGRGFTASTEVTSINIGGNAIATPSTIAISAEGVFVVDVVIPSWTGFAVAEYDITVDDGIETATAKFNLTGLPEITVLPVQGLPGTPVTVEGVNFTQIAGTVVTFELAGEPMGTLVTDIDGGLTGTLNTPVTLYGTKDLTADDGNVTAKTDFLVGMIYASLTPDEGPTGIEVSVAGTGFTASSTVNATLAGIIVFENVALTAEGTFPTETFFVPTVTIGDKNVTIMDAAGVTYEDTFTVTDTTRVELDHFAPNGYNVSIEGFNFADFVGLVDFVLYNSTEDWYLDLDVWQNGEGDDPVSTDIDGNFTGWWEVPADTILELVEYTMNITDGKDLFVQVTFEVVDVYMEMYPLLTEYDSEETVNFYVNSTFAFDLNLEIEDPLGYLYEEITCLEATWVQVGDYWVIPYAAHFELPNNAETGSWNWTAFDASDEVANGTFTVGEVVGPQPDLPAETTNQEPIDSSGASKTSFVLGETVLASSTITNTGTQNQPMVIIIQWTDPQLRALAPIVLITDLDPGDDLTYAPGLNIPLSGYTTGTWTATIMVLTDWPAQGGVTIGIPVTLTITVTE